MSAGNLPIVTYRVKKIKMKPLNGGFHVIAHLWNQSDRVRSLLTSGQLMHATTLAKLAEIVLIANNYERPYEVIYEPKNKQ